MTKTTRLSHSSINTYTSCARKYDLHYNKRLRSKTSTGALLFGSALDQALNKLLETKDLDEAQKVFYKSWSFGWINNKGIALSDTDLVLYAKSDFDSDLLTKEDLKKFSDAQYLFALHQNKTIDEAYAFLMDQKSTVGYKTMTLEERKLLSLANWLSLRRKGEIMINSYFGKVLPKIKTVLAVQKQVEIENGDGDRLIGYIDMLLEMQDGKRIVADNKSSSVEYEQDSPAHSQQLILYHHITKDDYQLNGAGFIVMSKHIIKNKEKICVKCGFNGSEGRHKSCPNELDSLDGKKKQRCGGEWDEKIYPEAKIDIIINEIPQAATDLVMETFDIANEGIKKGIFGPNLQACDDFNGCQFRRYCWYGDSEELEVVAAKEDK